MIQENGYLGSTCCLFRFRIALINDLQISFFNGFAIIKFTQILFVLIDVTLNFRVIRYVRDCHGFFLASLPL